MYGNMELSIIKSIEYTNYSIWNHHVLLFQMQITEITILTDFWYIYVSEIPTKWSINDTPL